MARCKPLANWGGQKVGTLTASYWKGYDTVGDRAYVIELYKK